MSYSMEYIVLHDSNSESDLSKINQQEVIETMYVTGAVKHTIPTKVVNNTNIYHILQCKSYHTLDKETIGTMNLNSLQNICIKACVGIFITQFLKHTSMHYFQLKLLRRHYDAY
jgi:hypothetical protein